MPIFLDDQAVSMDGEDLAAVLDAAQRRLEPDGRLVVEVQVDGETLTGERLADGATLAVAQREVRLYSADPRELAIDALDQVRARLDQVRDDQQRAADLLQQDNAPEALKLVSRCVEGWLQAQQTVGLAAELGGAPLDGVTVGDEPATRTLERLIEGLRTLKETLAHGDTVALADALAYEWPEHVDAWDRLVERLTAQIEG